MQHALHLLGHVLDHAGQQCRHSVFNLLVHLNVPTGYGTLLEVIVDEQHFRFLVGYGASHFVNNHQLGWVFIDCETVELNGYRQLMHVVVGI